MSYSNDACQERFSPQQVELMRAIAQGPRSYLLYNQTPPEEFSISDLNFVFPGSGDTIAVGSDSITLEWEMPGADYFFVTFGTFTAIGSPINLFTNKLVQGNQLKVKVVPDKNFFWKVRAANAYFYCSDLMAESLFSTLEEMTGTKEPGHPKVLVLKPNPAKDFLSIQLPEATAVPFEVQVFDAQGRPLLSRIVDAGQPLEVAGLPAGMYSVNVVAGERVFAGKFIKQ
jgi:hypothetical protein